MKKRFGLAAIAALALPMAAQAGNTVSGSSNGLTWTAESRIVGQTSTATVAGGGNPLYFAPASQSSGIVSIIINTPAGGFICSGTLLGDRRSIATAAHCVTDGSRVVSATSATVYFNGNNTPDSVTFQDPASTGIGVKIFTVNNDYTGEVIDQNDIAILTLDNLAPAWAASFGIYSGNDLTGQDFTVSGYGRRSDTGGNVGANLGTGRLRQGDNRYDFALGDSDFGGFFTDIDPATGEKFFGTADVTYSYLSDFDNGLAANDASCRLAVNGLGIAASSKFCDLGRGAREVGVAGGDSGGPSFINGQLAGITSYGLSFGPSFGDIGGGLNSSFGEFSGYVPTSIHRDFIKMAVSLGVPESSTWAMMIAGFGLVGASMRRRRTTVRFAAA
jgi:Trypsin